MKKTQTSRGFALIKFKDSNGIKCNVQKSSSALSDKIWLGAEDIGLQIGSPWQEVSEQEIKDKFCKNELIANNRMHLSRKQAAKLAKVLLKFAETGEI